MNANPIRMKKILIALLYYSFLGSIFSQTTNTEANEIEVDGLLKTANQLSEKREFTPALELMAKAEQFTLAQFNSSSLPYGKVCFQYGLIYHTKGEHPEAEKWFLQAKAIRRQILGAEHPDYAATLFRLGLVYFHLGNNYEKAEQNYLQALDIQEKKLGKNHLDYALTQFNLANIYVYLGNYILAEKLHGEALKTREKILGNKHMFYGEVLAKLGYINVRKKEYDKAELFYEENVDLLKGTIGKENTYYATALMGLGNVSLKRGENKQAEQFFLETKKILENLNSYTEIPAYMSCMEYLGMVYFELGDFDLSEKYHLQSKSLRERVLGKGHLAYLMSLEHLSVVNWKKGNYTKSANYFSESADFRRRSIMDASRHLSEQEVFSFTVYYETEFDQLYSFADDHITAVPNFAATCFDNTLFYKGFLLNTSQCFRSQNTGNPKLLDKLQHIQTYRNQLSAEYARPAAERDATKVKDLEEKTNTLEKELTRTVAGYGEVIRQVNWQELQSALAPGEAALEFIRFNYTNPKPTGQVRYAALLLKPNQPYPLFIPLFTEKDLEIFIPPLNKLRSEYINHLYQNPATAQLIWSPLLPHLQGVSKIFYAPAGLLHRLNLAALATSPQQIIGDRFDLVMLSSTRQLLALKRNTASALSSATLYGAIQYEMDSTAIPSASMSSGSGYRGLDFNQADSTLRGGIWRYLQHSEKETTNITAALQQSRIPTAVQKGYTASEEAFKNIGKQSPSPRILHLSTHGYFFPDPKTQVDAASGPAFKLSDHPMIRSGLILAGANHAWQTGHPLGNREDGVLTAYEISQMNLSNTELVVLSACETGLGEIRGSEGVYGLQRAFKSAGAKTLVMSLWQVPDFQTQELMDLFYQKLLYKKQNARQALLNAQQEMRRKGYAPYEWAGFVMVE